LQEHGQILKEQGESYYYQVRERFNQSPNSLDFLFLNRSCFNGVMRFNRKGQFNVPYCHKSERFSQAYITKIVNQVIAIENILIKANYDFQVADFRETLSDWQKTDLIYLDPPYLGRHVDYFNSWSEEDEDCLVNILKDVSCRFILSTWHSNQFRSNPLIKKNWSADKFCVYTKQHFYHVGSTEKLRHPITEAIITNFNIPLLPERGTDLQQLSLFASIAENGGVRTV
jgi:DNA adenine methylase